MISQGTRSITLSWTQSSEDIVDSYTVQYSASVRGCSDVPVMMNTMTLGSTTTMFEITGLEEDGIIMGTVDAVNIGGSVSAEFTINTNSASRCA